MPEKSSQSNPSQYGSSSCPSLTTLLFVAASGTRGSGLLKLLGWKKSVADRLSLLGSFGWGCKPLRNGL